MRVRHGLVAWLGVWMLVGGCGRDARSPRSVVLVTLDTTRWDRLGIYGDPAARTPFFDAAGRAGVVFENAFVDVPSTLPSHASMMTGAHSLRHGVRLNGEFSLSAEATTLAERFGSRGYATSAVIASSALRSVHGLGKGFDRWDGSFRAPFRGFDPALEFRSRRHAGTQRRADEISDIALEQLAALPEPLFLWLHYVDPHLTYDPPPPWNAVPGLTPYAGEIAFTDQEFGRVRRRLDELDSVPVVAVLADHGEGLGEHHQDGHGMFLYESTTRIPFLVQTPGAPPRVERGMVQTADLAPSLEVAAGLEASTWPDGVDQVGAPASREHLLLESLTPTRYGGTPIKGSRSDGYKFVHAPRPEFYDLINDPDELTNLFEGDAKQVGELMSWMEDEVARLVAAGPLGDSRVDLDDSQIEALRSLGYVASREENLPSDELSVVEIDPKDLIDVVLAVRYVGDGRYADARRRLDRFFASYPEFPGPGWAPMYAKALYSLAQVEGVEGNLDRIYERVQRAVELDPEYAEALETLERMRDLGETGGR